MSDVFPFLCINTIRAFFHALGDLAMMQICVEYISENLDHSISSILKDATSDVYPLPALYCAVVFITLPSPETIIISSLNIHYHCQAKYFNLITAGRPIYRHHYTKISYKPSLDHNSGVKRLQCKAGNIFFTFLPCQ